MISAPSMKRGASPPHLKPSERNYKKSPGENAGCIQLCRTGEGSGWEIAKPHLPKAQFSCNQMQARGGEGKSQPDTFAKD